MTFTFDGLQSISLRQQYFLEEWMCELHREKVIQYRSFGFLKNEVDFSRLSLNHTALRLRSNLNLYMFLESYKCREIAESSQRSLLLILVWKSLIS